MKLNKAILLMILAASSAACQRGEDDPMFSLLTRKQRLAGSWKTTEYFFSKNDTSAVLTGDSLIITLPDSSVVATQYSLEFVFNTDGTYTQKKLEISESDSNISTVETIISGNWEFTGGNNSPSKSKLALFEKDWQQTTGVSGSNIKATSTSGQAFPTVFDLKELRKDKVVLTQKIIESDPFTSDTTSLSFTLEPQ